MGLSVHHTGIIAGDIERSLRFYRDGIGLDVLTDIPVVEGDWPSVFGVPSRRARSISLGDRNAPSAGVLELLEFEGVSYDAPSAAPTNGFLLVSFLGVDVDVLLGRLRDIGFDSIGRIVGQGPTSSFDMATVRDPDGVLVELVELLDRCESALREPPPHDGHPGPAGARPVRCPHVSSGSREPRGPGPKALATRQRLIDAAARLFAERGYERTSVRDVGHELGMTTGAVYRHFRNKAELLAAAVASTIAEQVEHPQSISGLHLYRDGASQLLASHPDQAALRALLLDAAAAAKSDPVVRARLRDVQLEHMSEWVTVASRDQADGTLDAEVAPETLVKLLWALEFGLAIFDVFGMEPPDPGQTGVVVSRLLHPSVTQGGKPTAPARRAGRAAGPAARRRAD